MIDGSVCVDEELKVPPEPWFHSKVLQEGLQLRAKTNRFWIQGGEKFLNLVVRRLQSVVSEFVAMNNEVLLGSPPDPLDDDLIVLMAASTSSKSSSCGSCCGPPARTKIRDILNGLVLYQFVQSFDP